LLQAIFERAIEEGHEIRNPFRGIKRGKDKARTRVLTLDEETKLMGALHPRFQRFVRFALGTGCRLAAIRGIDSKRNIDWVRGTVHVLGKFAKERDVPMQPDAKAALKEQLDAEGKLWTQNQQRLREVLAEGAVRARVTHLTPTRCATRSERGGCGPAATSTSCRGSWATPAWPSPKRTMRTC
jgi:integrase